MGKALAAAGVIIVGAATTLVTGIAEGAATWVVGRLPASETSSTSGPPGLSPEPLTVAVTTDIGNAGDRFALASKLTDGPAAVALMAGDPNDSWPAFLDEHGGAPVGSLAVKMVFTGQRDPQVRVTDIQVSRAENRPVLNGSVIELSIQGEAESIKMSANLDEARPRIFGEDGKPYFSSGGNIDLKKGEQQTLQLTLTAEERFHRWSFVIDYVDEEGQPQRVFVDRLGRISRSAPTSELFTLTGPANGYGTTWVENFPFEGFRQR
ncbi:hypothetical protein ACQEUX_16330 [Micromonospora sp. CA-259024]|uniref:hypothetical protein n=1 Tax=Micromonospora sp. CA-259024 TaxID=3239965 RepID=UPI003D8A48B9